MILRWLAVNITSGSNSVFFSEMCSGLPVFYASEALLLGRKMLVLESYI